MSRKWIQGVSLVCAVVLVMELTTTSTEARPRARPVAPWMEIEILEPNVDPSGNPAVIQERGADGQLHIKIPPTVLVHRYYFNGERSFQGPLFRGGPCIVVVNHPKTGEQLNLPVQMFPGSPRVIYKDDAIQYVFRRQYIEIKFGRLFNKARVYYYDDPPVGTRIRNAASEVTSSTKALLDRTGLPELSDRAKQGTKSLVLTSIDRTQDVVELVTLPVRNAVRLLPGGTWLSSNPDELERRRRDMMLRRARYNNQIDERVYLPTNR